uniref:Cysteine-rich venom protein n=1 Tax=Hemiscolopendra marginata TaxID=943146 RepID=A0A646QD03_9MYRI
MKNINWLLAVFLLLSCNSLLGDTCTVIETYIDDLTKAKILELHNKARAKVANGQQSGQPTASNMKELQWSNELAVAAQTWVEACNRNHPSQAERKTKKYSLYGQNYYWGFGSDSLIKHVGVAVKMWYDEVKFLNPNVVSSYDGNYKLHGHYTAMIWGETEVMGCGYAKEAADNRVNLFCNYAPAEYFVGRAIYKTGPTASKCSNGQSTSYPGLCK